MLSGFELKPSLKGTVELPVRLPDGPTPSFQNWGLQSNSNLLAITQTCRQIQEEASLLPFSLKPFYIPFSVELISFIPRLIPRQRIAITTIGCHHAINDHRFSNGMDPHKVELRDILGSLKGLQRLVVMGSIGRLPKETQSETDYSIQVVKNAQKLTCEGLRELMVAKDVDVVAEEVCVYDMPDD